MSSTLRGKRLYSDFSSSSSKRPRMNGYSSWSGRYPRVRGVSNDMALQHVPRARRSTKVGGRVKARISGNIKKLYSLRLSSPVTCVRAQSYIIQSSAAEQAVVTYICHKLRTAINTNRAQLAVCPANEYDLLRTTAIDNVSVQDTLPRLTRTATSTTVVGALPYSSWTLGDAWALRDMLLYARGRYNQDNIKFGYIPPTTFQYPQGVPAIYGGAGATGGISFTPSVALNYNAFGFFANAGGTPETSDIPNNLLAIPYDQMHLNGSMSDSTDTGGWGQNSLGALAQNLVLHNQTISFTVTNMEETPVDVTVYELILKQNEPFQYSTSSALRTGVTTTTRYCPMGNGLPDPVEIWQTFCNQSRHYGKPQGSDLDPGHTNAENAAGVSTTMTRRSVYEVGMDPLHYLNRYYKVKRRTARIGVAGKHTFNFVVKHNGTIPKWWFDQLYGIAGFTRTYMMRVHGTPGLARTSATETGGISLGRAATDANVRVDVVKSFRCAMTPVRIRTNYVERVPRVLSSSITEVVSTRADGTLDVNQVEELNATATTTNKVAFAENSGQLA